MTPLRHLGLKSIEQLTVGIHIIATDIESERANVRNDIVLSACIDNSGRHLDRAQDIRVLQVITELFYKRYNPDSANNGIDSFITGSMPGQTINFEVEDH